MTHRTAPAVVVVVVLLAGAAAAATRQLPTAGIPIMLPGAHRTVPQPSVGAPQPAQTSSDRRDLFAPPPGAMTDSTSRTSLPELPPIPEAPGPLPAGLPLPPIAPTVPGMTSGHEAPPLPPVELAGLILGGSPQAVLRSGSTYLIVHRGGPHALGHRERHYPGRGGADRWDRHGQPDRDLFTGRIAVMTRLLGSLLLIVCLTAAPTLTTRPRRPRRQPRARRTP